MHNYSGFQVNTIDSFVQKIIRAFTFEMNLNSGYDIELDTGKVIDGLSEMLYDTIAENKELQKRLIRFARSKTEENKSWDFNKDIKVLAQEMFKEQFQELYGAGITKFDEKTLSSFLQKLYAIKSAFESKMNDFADRYESIIAQKSIDRQALGAKFKNISNHFLVKIKERKKYDDFTTTIIKAREGIEHWHAKSASPEILRDIHAVYPELSEVLEAYFSYFEKESENYYSASEIIKNFHAFGILNDLAGLLPEYRNENNVLLISDTAYLLKGIIGNNDAPFIYEKTGNRIHHIFIDEFQDTSSFQWQIFKPLIENALSEGFGNLIVGDIKQSIYRWRNGDWKLLFSGVSKDIGKDFITEKTLEENYRSLKNIVLFNNAMFRIIPQLLQEQYNNKLAEVNNPLLKQELMDAHYDRMLIEAYKDHAQNVPAGKEGGSVHISFLEKKSYEDELADKLPVLIDDLLRKKNKRPKDIGILLRTNKQAKYLTELLTAYQNESPDRAKYKIISGESLYLENSSAVRVLVAAMQYILDPDNAINLAQLLMEYQILQHEKPDKNKLLLSIKDKSYAQYLPERFLENISVYTRLELFDLSEALISVFKMADKTREFAYLKSFQNCIGDFTRKQYSDLSEFIDWWNEKGFKTSVQISDKTDALNIMTIHKSKGLAFDTVIMPYATFRFEHSGSNAPILWVKNDKAPFNRFPFLPIKYSEKLKQTVFKKDYFDELLYSYTDAVNMLYVTFTRAKTALYVFAPSGEDAEKKGKPGMFKTSGELLYHIVNKSNSFIEEEQGSSVFFADYYDPKTEIFDYSAADSEQTIREVQEKEADFLQLKEDFYPNTLRKAKLKLKYNSEDFMIESIPEIEEKVNYGKLMHRIFQHIERIEDVQKAVMKEHYAGVLLKEEAEALSEKITRVISSPEILLWFNGSYTTLNEDALLTVKGDIRIPDKVLFSEKEIILIDFKFGKHYEKYTAQLQEYQALLEDLYKLPVQAYLFYPEEKEKIIPIGH